MTDKNMKKSQKNSALPKEDIQLYRLFAIFGAAILGFAALNLVNESKLLGFLLRGGIWGLLFCSSLPLHGRFISAVFGKSTKAERFLQVSAFLIF